MDRVERSLLAIALTTAAGPAAASDFTGFFSMFMAMPFLTMAGLISVFILLRRFTARMKGPVTYAPLLPLLPAWFLMACLCLYMQQFLWVGIPLLTIGFVVAARRIWRDPRGRLAAWTARVLLAISVAVGPFMVWDMRIVANYRGTNDALGMIVLFGSLWCLCVGLCVYASLGRSASVD